MINIALLQETHTTSNIENIWKAQWRGRVIFSHGTSKARGVAILVSPKYKDKILLYKTDIEGRFVIITIAMQERFYTIASIYAPNEDKC